jgi:hypothetical protein
MWQQCAAPLALEQKWHIMQPGTKSTLSEYRTWNTMQSPHSASPAYHSNPASLKEIFNGNFNIFMCNNDYIQGLDWWLDLLTTYAHDLRTTSNYSASTNLHNSQITTAPVKPFPACCVFINCSLSMASNSRDSSASYAQVLSSQILVQKCLTTDFVLTFPKPLPRNSHCLQSHGLVMGLYATICI